MSPVVDVANLGVCLGGAVVLEAVSLRVSRCESVAVLGPSGSGKSTLLAAIAGELAPTSGTIRVYAQTVALVHQSAPVLAARTAIDNVELAVLATGGGFGDSAERAACYLAQVGLERRTFHTLSGRLSGGERQRLGLARALAMRPQLLLADEPTAQLDRTSAAEIVDVVAGGALAGTTSVVATHDIRLAEACDRVVSL